MYFLLETCAGYALIKKSPFVNGPKNFRITNFFNFKTKTESLNSCLKLLKGKMPKNLKHFLLNVNDKNSTLVVNDPRLRFILNKKINKVFSKVIVKNFCFRRIRQCLYKIFNNNLEKKIILTQKIYGHKLKINGSKIDSFLNQTIRVIDEMDKQFNFYSTRLREWYSWHFPELYEILRDNIIYAKCILKFETRDKIKTTDLSDILNKNLIDDINEISEISTGVRIYKDDLNNILCLCRQILSIDSLRSVITKYVKNRMYFMAPNLSNIVGEQIGARLISHCGSLLNLSKTPSSKIQIFGAEKSLYKALKSSGSAPKYGFIYNAKIINSCDNDITGKISRVVSAKSSLCSRIDALGENKFGGTFGIKNKIYIEKKIKQLSSMKNRSNILNN